MEQVKMNNMYINIDVNNGSEKYTEKNTAVSGKLIKAVYASYVLNIQFFI
jgi:hypothetical protein